MKYYVVINHFTDKEDKHSYDVGEIFPHDKRKITKKRLNELMSDKNKQGKQLIEEVIEDVEKIEEVTE